jgi:hypothetical protein
LHPGKNLKAAVSGGDSGIHGLPAANQNHIGAADLGAGGICDYSANGGGLAEDGSGKKRKNRDGAEEGTRPLSVEIARE